MAAHSQETIPDTCLPALIAQESLCQPCHSLLPSHPNLSHECGPCPWPGFYPLPHGGGGRGCPTGATLWAAKRHRCLTSPASTSGFSCLQMQKKVSFLPLTFPPLFFWCLGWSDVGGLEGGGCFQQWSLGWSRQSFLFSDNLALTKTDRHWSLGGTVQGTKQGGASPPTPRTAATQMPGGLQSSWACGVGGAASLVCVHVGRSQCLSCN